MSSQATVIFVDLSGSTKLFELLGNERATETVTNLMGWIATAVESHAGRVVKTLGDGVLAVFRHGGNAMSAVLELQRAHEKRCETWPSRLRMDLKIGVAQGEVVTIEGDCYGDAVNVAARLSDLAGPQQIWVTESVIDQASHLHVRHRSLGPINIRGKSEMPVVHRVDWRVEDVTDFLTLPATLVSPQQRVDDSFQRIELGWLGAKATFIAAQMPIHLGRVDVQFVVDDPRVSRRHVRLEVRNGSCVLVDVSSYGTWVRLQGADTSSVVALRREECVLHGSGEISLGAPIGDFSAPTVSFRTVGGTAGVRFRPRATDGFVRPAAVRAAPVGAPV